MENLGKEYDPDLARHFFAPKQADVKHILALCPLAYAIIESGRSLGGFRLTPHMIYASLAHNRNN
jgi:hypothetical protein